MTEQLLAYDDRYEVSNALVWRDGIHDALSAGERLSPEETATLAQADRRYVAARPILARRFPDLYEGLAPREYWWWYADEEPCSIATEMAIRQRA